ncbi:hypothetical protein O5D80_006411 [Batrachochytrium dendrobatidis]|nr:hypothetical protein O5D80_006411 [Batrachochytrium dendrobatidis]
MEQAFNIDTLDQQKTLVLNSDSGSTINTFLLVLRVFVPILDEVKTTVIRTRKHKRQLNEILLSRCTGNSIIHTFNFPINTARHRNETHILHTQSMVTQKTRHFYMVYYSQFLVFLNY